MVYFVELVFPTFNVINSGALCLLSGQFLGRSLSKMNFWQTAAVTNRADDPEGAPPAAYWCNGPLTKDFNMLHFDKQILFANFFANIFAKMMASFFRAYPLAMFVHLLPKLTEVCQMSAKCWSNFG